MIYQSEIFFNNPITNTILKKTHNEMNKRYGKNGKWSNFITEILDLCSRNERDEIYIIPQFIFKERREEKNHIQELPDFDTITKTIVEIEKNLKISRKENFRSGIAETIKYLLARKHTGNEESAEKLLDLLNKAYTKKNEEKEKENIDEEDEEV